MRFWVTLQLELDVDDEAIAEELAATIARNAYTRIGVEDAWVDGVELDDIADIEGDDVEDTDVPF